MLTFGKMNYQPPSRRDYQLTDLGEQLAWANWSWPNNYIPLQYHKDQTQAKSMLQSIKNANMFTGDSKLKADFSVLDRILIASGMLWRDMEYHQFECNEEESCRHPVEIQNSVLDFGQTHEALRNIFTLMAQCIPTGHVLDDGHPPAAGPSTTGPRDSAEHSEKATKTSTPKTGVKSGKETLSRNKVCNSLTQNRHM